MTAPATPDILRVRFCSVPGCEREHEALGLCHLHYKRQWRRGTVEVVTRLRSTCTVPDCSRAMAARGLCLMHYKRMRASGTTTPPPPRFGSQDDRFAAKHVQDPMSGCWLWTGNMNKDYGAFYANGKTFRAHRWAYERFIGPIPDGLELDHLCRTPACVNPAHLEPVTTAENLRRKNAAITACPTGHDYTPENTYIDPCGGRRCRTCDALRRQERSARR